MQTPLILRHLGTTDFNETCLAMRIFTTQRNAETPDELWLTEHPPVYSLGLNRKNVRLPQRDDIPLVLTDRGGKITYHGPGQVIIYLLIDLKRYQKNIRKLVTLIESAVIELLSDFAIVAVARTEAPGVYIKDKKIASLGLRIKNNCCYHGLSLNINMDLKPFNAIDPCGYTDLEVTQLKDLGVDIGAEEVGAILLNKLAYNLTIGYRYD